VGRQLPFVQILNVGLDLYSLAFGVILSIIPVGLPYFRLELFFCTVAVYRGALNEVLHMATRAARAGKSKSDNMPRTSISFPPGIYKSLEDLAAKKKVSIAWVVRDAVEKYVGDEFPLFGTSLLKREQ
jgi:hypothetical protein